MHVGDSTSVGLISASYLSDPAKRIDEQYRRVGVVDVRSEISGARSIVETMANQVNAHDIAAEIKASGYQGCWVLALGTTDTANVAVADGGRLGRAERIDTMMDLVNGDPVLWVNVKTIETDGVWADDQMQVWNDELVAATKRYPNLRVLDWAAAARDEWFADDRIHYNAVGYAARAQLIADGLAIAFPA